MSFDVGFNFRGSSGYVTDGTGETYVVSADTYPTTRNGVTFGWESGPAASVDRDSGNDRRLAGVAGVGTGHTFRVDLPGADVYDVRLAIGDAASNQDVRLEVRDTSSVLITIDRTGASQPTTQHFYDATDVLRTNLTWPGSNAASRKTFATSILRMVGLSGGGTTVFAHLFVSQIGSAFTTGSASEAATARNGRSHLTCTSPSGGTAPYSYQWQRSATSGSGFSNVASATSLTLDDTGLANGATYYYRLVATDSAGSPATVNSNEVTVLVVATGNIVFEGDSWTYGQSATNPGTVTGTTYEAAVMDVLASSSPIPWAGTNVGHSGDTWADLETQASATDALYDAAAPVNVLCVLCGINDIGLSGRTGAQCFADGLSYVTDRKAAGWRVVWVTLPPNAQGIGSSAFETQRVAFNNLVVSSGKPPARALARLDLNTDIGEAGDDSDATYYQGDHVHLTNAGYLVLGRDVVAPAVLLAAAGGVAVLPLAGGGLIHGGLIHGGLIGC